MERSLLDSVKGPTECERSHVFSGLDGPAIRFVPDKDVTLENSKTTNVQLRLNNAKLQRGTPQTSHLRGWLPGDSSSLEEKPPRHHHREAV